MAIILDGKKLSSELTEILIGKIRSLSIQPKLVIIQVGDNDRSNVFIERKKAFGKKIGVLVEHKKYSSSANIDQIKSDISQLNKDETVHGVIVQLPVPEHMNSSEIIDMIDPQKDVDGLTSKNTKAIFDNKPKFIPATTKGILTMLERSGVSLEGKKVVVVGRSKLVGKPTALMCVNRNATVTVCHSQTSDLASHTKQADILIVATGHPHLITASHVSRGQTIIDVGITVASDKKIVGDVDFEHVTGVVAAITPVPGGVGPMTVFSLFENVVEACISKP